MAFVTRVAVPPAELTHDVSVPLCSDELVRLRGVLVRVVDAELLNSVTSASVSGQSFTIFEGEQRDSLLSCVAIHGSKNVAVPIPSFLVEDATLSLQDDFQDEVFRITVKRDDDDNGPLELVVSTGGQDDDSEVYELNSADARVYRDVIGKAVPSHAACLATIRRPRTSARCVNVEKQVYQLPSWYGDIFVAFLSRALRLHVLARASLPDAPPVPLSLVDGGRCVRTHGGPGAGAPTLRCTVQLHEASIGCICGLHKGGSNMPHFKCVQLTLQTCGARCVAGHAGCDLHRRAPQPTSALAARACLGDAKLTMRCMHCYEDDRKVHSSTVMNLPASDPFLAAMSAAAVELVEVESPPAPDRIKDALCAAFRSGVASRSGRTSEEELVKRDDIALSLLAEGRHFFGTVSARGKTPALRLRDNPQAAVEAHLRNAMVTHGHLLATK